jgi:hypothetical protein
MAMTTADNARIRSKSLSAMFLPTGFPVIATVPRPRLQLHALAYQLRCCFGSKPCDAPIWYRLGSKPYGSNRSKSGLVLSEAFAICGFTSPQTGPDAIGLSRSTNILTNSPNCPRLTRTANNRPRTSQSQPTQARVFLQNAFSLAQPPRIHGPRFARARQVTVEFHTMRTKYKIFDPFSKTMNNAGSRE